MEEVPSLLPPQEEAPQGKRLIELFDKITKNSQFYNINQIKAAIKRSVIIGVIANAFFLGKRRTPKLNVSFSQLDFRIMEGKLNTNLEKEFKDMGKFLKKREKSFFDLIPRGLFRPRGPLAVYKWLSKRKWTEKQAEGVDFLLLSMLHESTKLSKLVENASSMVDDFFSKYSKEFEKNLKTPFLWHYLLSGLIFLPLFIYGPGAIFFVLILSLIVTKTFMSGKNAGQLIKSHLNQIFDRKAVSLLKKMSELFVIALFFWDYRKNAITVQLSDYPLKEQFEKDLEQVIRNIKELVS